jgi:hypothetical protein
MINNNEFKLNNKSSSSSAVLVCGEKNKLTPG